MRDPVLAIVLVAAAGGCAPEPAGAQPPAATPSLAPAPDAPAPAPAAAPDVAGPSGHVATDSPPPEPIEPIGVPACDAYLALYVACEPRLKHEIAGGHRRAPRNEAAWLRYMHTEVKDPGVADSCKRMLESLRPHCPAT